MSNFVLISDSYWVSVKGQIHIGFSQVNSCVLHLSDYLRTSVHLYLDFDHLHCLAAVKFFFCAVKLCDNTRGYY
jgi:hypothetical protein